ncbi:teashirt homolog 1-like [Engraulis encrasicolus]|uniref:teashirt homolog 1-like n=1 Tax=Engraulis encrasicolus TaxID=184585 RepID=UPI002FD5D0CC
MPRRKQQEPRRSAVYMPEDDLKGDGPFDEEEHLRDDGLSLDGQDAHAEFLCNEEDDEAEADAFRVRPPSGSFRGSPLSNGTNPDAGYGSPLSDASDRLADLKSTSSRDDGCQDGKEDGGLSSYRMDTSIGSIGGAPSSLMGSPNSGSLALHDSLAQMKAVYANLLSDASWSRIAMDIMKAKPVSSSPGGRGGIPPANAPLALAATKPAAATATCPSSSASSATSHSHSHSSSHHNGKSATVNPPPSSANGNSNGTPTPTALPVPGGEPNGNGGGGIAGGNPSNGGNIAYDWHQAALAKTLQQTPYHLLPEPSLFSTVQLYRQNNKLYGSVFTGASKFRCKDCSAAYDTLVGLTVHMNETGHYRDDNKDKEEEDSGKRWSKPRKRSLMEMEGKEDAQKVLKCMYCGHSFESLQDLSVHMIKTKHYQKVPLKEPVPALATKLVPSAKKRALQDSLISPCSPETMPASGAMASADPGKDPKLAANPYVTPNNRYGYQNGASYTWQFEARKAQILKCMECGSSHDTLQQLTAHMMVTGHFLKVTNSASKKGKQLVFDPVVEEKFQSIPLPPTTTRLPVPPSVKSQPVSPALSTGSEGKREMAMEGERRTESSEPEERKIKEEKDDEKSGGVEKKESDSTSSYKYLREEDLDETPNGGLDILKSLENTVSSAISKAQTGTPTWGGYPSIHAAYQLQGALKPSSLLSPSVQSVPMQPAFSSSSMRAFVTDPGSVIHSPRSPSSPPSLRSNVSAMEELVEKMTGGKAAAVKKEKEERVVSDGRGGGGGERCGSLSSSAKSPSQSPPVQRAEQRDQRDGTGPIMAYPTAGNRSTSPRKAEAAELVCKKEPKDSPLDTTTLTNHHHPHPHHAKNGPDANTTCRSSPITNGTTNSLGIITDHSPERPFINPLSALQSIMNTHLSKASKPINPAADPLSMLFKISNSVSDKPPVFNNTNATQVKQQPDNNPVNNRFFYESNDQPIDLSKSKSGGGGGGGGAGGDERSGNATSSIPLNSSMNGNSNRPLGLCGLPFPDSGLSSPLRENALMDISDMVKNLTGRLTPSNKSSTPSSISEKSDVEGSVTFEDALDDLSPSVQGGKRKGRQSNWNPQHLLILQAQFASSLRETPEGRYAMTDLGPQERVHICKFTGLSMTTISHWLANVKYQLRRTGGTKFLKNMDSCQPVFLCGDCASQFRTPAAYIAHLESHLGFSLKDLSKLSADHLREQQAVSKVIGDKLASYASPLASMMAAVAATAADDDSGSGAIYQCRLCNRTFVSKHAIKLHLSKTHGKSPEDHLVFVTALEKLEKQEKV